MIYFRLVSNARKLSIKDAFIYEKIYTTKRKEEDAWDNKFKQLPVNELLKHFPTE